MEEKVLEKQKSPMGVAALVLGILSIVFELFWYISIPTGILGIVLGVKSSRKTGSKLGKAGMITGIIGIAMCLFIYISLCILIILENAY